jgi:dipeptidyl-peptidase-4
VQVRISSAQGGFARMEVLRADGSIAGELPAINEPLPFEVRLEVEKRADFWTALVRPHDFDSKRKYPVLLEVYGGPHVNTVHRFAPGYIAEQWIADHGFIIAHADGRGSPGRGRAWERAIEKKFAEVPLEDQVTALRAMAAQEPAMDLSRVGVMGHSFGGFMAALAVMRRPDVFRAGVAGAPVVDWMNYDTCYTERYLGIPPPLGKSDAYARNGLLAYAKDLQRPLLLMHGTADDNVHFSESLLLVDALFRTGHSDDVDFLPFAAQTHLFHEPVLMQRYWQRVFGFLQANLITASAR